MNKAMNQPKATIWIPAAFCGMLSLMKVFLSGAGDPVFFCFLPMCFIFVGINQLVLQKRIESLEAQLKEPSRAMGSMNA
jgi:hypothetical protein